MIAKGLRINLSKSGTSLSVGGRGATVNFSKRGTKVTAGLPGTGLSWSETVKPHDHQEDMQQHLPPNLHEQPARKKLPWWPILAVIVIVIVAGTLKH